MRAATTPYRAVYHFHDDHLLETFVAKIPRSRLIEHLRGNEALRNRYFPGFRISNTVPTLQQVMNAYKKEIVDHDDAKLASVLCALWVRQQPELASVALKSLGIESKNSADANLWINDVHAKLEGEQYEDSLRALVRALVMQFSSEDVHIFASIISHGIDQQTVRQIVDQELSSVANDPWAAKEQIEANLEATNKKIGALQHLSSELQHQLESRMAEAQTALDASVQEDEKLTTSLVEEEASTQALTKQLEAIQKDLLERQRATHAKKEQKQKLLGTIKRQREELATAQAKCEKQLKDVSQDLSEQWRRVAELTDGLQQVQERILAEEGKKSAATAAPANAPPERAPFSAPEPIPSPSKPAVEPPKAAVELLGNNAICYQGIQRTFRNTVVAFLRERFARLFPGDHLQRMKETFGEEWEKSKQNAIQSREILGTTTAMRDEYDLLGTNHFFNIFERFYDKLFAPEAGQPTNLPKPVKARFLGNLKAIKDGRDPLSHPVEEEISFEEAHNLLCPRRLGGFS